MAPASWARETRRAPHRLARFARSPQDPDQPNEVSGKVEWYPEHLPGECLHGMYKVSPELPTDVARHLQQVEHCLPNEVTEDLLPPHADPPPTRFAPGLS